MINWPPHCPLCGAASLAKPLYGCDCDADRIWAVLEQNQRSLVRQQAFVDSVPLGYRDYLHQAPPGNRTFTEDDLGKIIYLWGPPGRGKSHFAVYFAHSLLGTGRSGLFASEVDYFSKVFKEMSSKIEAPDLNQPDVLVYDDLGKQNTSSHSEFPLQKIFHMVESRWLNQKTTFITSQYSPEQVAARLTSDPAGQKALISRLSSGRIMGLHGPTDHRVFKK